MYLVGAIRQGKIFLTVYSPAVMLSAFRFTGSDAESTKGGMLMKSKHCTYGKKATYSDFCSYRLNDTIPHKSTIAASAKVGYCNI